MNPEEMQAQMTPELTQMIPVFGYNWSIKNFLYWPSKFQATPNKLSVNSSNFRPFIQAPFFTSKFKNMIISPISCLLFHGRPFAVFFRVISIIINSIYRSIRSVNSKMFEIRFIHIIPKFFKGLPKTFYPSRPVTKIVNLFRIFTSFTHRIIDIIESWVQVSFIHNLIMIP